MRVLSTDLFPFGRTTTTDLIQVLDEYTNLDLQEGIPDILNFMLWEWKKCLLHQESCVDTTQSKKCNPDLLVLAMRTCVSEKEQCDSFASCSSAKEEKLDCSTDESTLGQHLCHNFTDCHRCFTCCQSSASSEKICLPRMDFQINWRALQKQ
ncbi:uncharacterized protein LOC143227445 [Tachypleus tridentatus]|uniref:uncharacterized protein LOC143227445 n=1 Tax=Tachypleus tridentatus TaxID=6853 RepID=UPI003FD1C528